MPVKIELAKARDCHKVFLLGLRKLTMSAHLEAAGFVLTEREHVAGVEENFAHAYIILAESREVGMVKYRSTGEVVEIMQLQILPECQGSGIGYRVVEMIIAHARRRECALKLSVLKRNPAKRLYERMGFAVIGEDRHEFHMEWVPWRSAGRARQPG